MFFVDTAKRNLGTLGLSPPLPPLVFTPSLYTSTSSSPWSSPVHNPLYSSSSWSSSTVKPFRRWFVVWFRTPMLKKYVLVVGLPFHGFQSLHLEVPQRSPKVLHPELDSHLLLVVMPAHKETPLHSQCFHCCTVQVFLVLHFQVIVIIFTRKVRFCISIFGISLSCSSEARRVSSSCLNTQSNASSSASKSPSGPPSSDTSLLGYNSHSSISPSFLLI